jgi:hypothetical protein
MEFSEWELERKLGLNVRSTRHPTRPAEGAWRHGERGTTLVEALIAVLIALIGVFGLGSLIFEATVTNKNRGTEVTRATIYAQDKMEKLLSLDFNACSQASSMQPASCNTTNMSGVGWTQGLLAGGATGPLPQPVCPSSGPSIGYIDFLSVDGLQLPVGGPGSGCSALSGANVGYVRMWQITDLPTTGGPPLEQVSVSVYSMLAVNTGAARPIVTLTTYLSDPY